MSSIRTTMELEIDVSFSDPSEIQAEFIDSDWGEVFYPLDTLLELAQTLSEMFHNTEHYWDGDGKVKYLEGFGYFKYNDGKWCLYSECFGTITIRYEMELCTTGVYELGGVL